MIKEFSLFQVNLVSLLDTIDASESVPDATSASFSVVSHKLILQFDGDLTPEEDSALSALVAAHDPNPLQTAKIKKIAAIDQRTVELIDEGFSFNGITFSGSIESQSRIIAAYIAKDLNQYPITWMSKDDSEHILITDATMVAQFFQMGLGTLRYKIDLGSTLKIAVTAATTLEELDVISDPR